MLKAFGNYDPDLVSIQTAVFNDEPSMTQQHHAKDADINEIVRRFGLTGVLPTEGLSMPSSGDFSGVGSYQEAWDAVRAAQEAFLEVPAELRARFGNDPGALIDFLGDAANREEAIKLGLVVKPPEKTRDAVDAIDELSAKFVPAKFSQTPPL